LKTFKSDSSLKNHDVMESAHYEMHRSTLPDDDLLWMDCVIFRWRRRGIVSVHAGPERDRDIY
jgi:hypothetical protein